MKHHIQSLSTLALLVFLGGCASSASSESAAPELAATASSASPVSVRVREAASEDEPSAVDAAAPNPAAQEAATPMDRVFPYDVVRDELDNGLRVLVVPMPSDGLVSYWSIVRTGSRDEVEPGVTGFAHFFEHMMFRGSERFPGPVYDGIVNSMGADANAFTTDDFTAYHMSFSAEDLPRVVEIEADRFQNLQYTEPEFRTEAGAVFGEYRKGRTNPFSVLFEGIQDTAFDVHTYKHTTIGFVEDIEAMPEQFAYSKTFFERFYRPENVVLLIAGDVDPQAALAEVEKRYAGWRTGYVEPEVRPEPPQRGLRRTTIEFEGQTLPILALNFKAERFLPGDRERVALGLIGELAFGETSPLYKKLVLDEQRVDVLAAWVEENRDPGLWAAVARVKDPGDVSSIEAEMWGALRGLQEGLVEPQRLVDARSRLRYSFLSGLSTPNGVCESLARIVAVTGDLTAVDQLYATLDAVTPEDVRAAARRWLVPEGCTVAVLHTQGEPPVPAVAGAEPPVLMPVPNDPNVAFKVWFRVGSQDDPAGKEGLAALTAALVEQGATRSRSYDQILAELFPMAASYGASVDKEMTVFSGFVHREKAEAFYPLFADALLAPAFRQEDFERLRDATVSGLETTLRFASDEELGKAVLTAAVFRGTPYQHPTEGTVQSLKALTLDDVRAFHAAHWTRDNLVIGLAGAYDASLPARLGSDLGRLPAGTPEPTPPPAAPRPQGRRVTIVEKPGPSVAISFGYPIDVHRGSREFYALWIANSWLGEHRNSSSHLYQVIREERGMNYGDYSYIEAFPNGGARSMPPTGVGRRGQMFEVWIRPVPAGQEVFALRAALRELDHLATHGLTEEQFEDTKRFLKKYSLHFAETTFDRLGYAVDDRFYGLDESHLARFRRMMDEVTYEEVQAAVRRVLRTTDLEIAMVAADAAGLRDRLVSDAPSPMDYGAIEKPAELLAEDEEIAVWPLGIEADDVTIVPVEEVFEVPAPRAGS